METITSLVLHCPKCGTEHHDVGEWRDRPHKTHLCLNEKCGHLWRPAEEYTRGVSVEEASRQVLHDTIVHTWSEQELRAIIAEGRASCGHLMMCQHYNQRRDHCVCQVCWAVEQ